MKKFYSILIAAALLFALAIPAAAADDGGKAPSQKEEVVYGILGSDGSVESVYVVNIFGSGDVTDYGSYTSVENLTTADPIDRSGEEITVSSDTDRLYYKGTLDTAELPWDIAVTYTLDGNAVTASQLGGETGELQIHITVTQNPDTDGFFYENYALQISLLLDTSLCENIIADGATVAEAGGDKQLSYIVLPGKGADITVTASVHDFVMDSITFGGVKLALDMDVDESEFTGQIGELQDAIVQLDDGAGGLLDGVTQLRDGMSQYLSGLKAYKDGLGQLSGGASELSQGASALEDGLAQMASQGQTLASAALTMRQSAFDAANAQLSGMGFPTLTPSNYAAVLSAVPDLAALKAQLDGVVEFTSGVIAYTQGVASLEDGAADLGDGASQLSTSLSAVADAAQDLYDGASQLDTAVAALRDGLSDYKDGTAELRDGTGDMDSEISSMIDDILAEITGGDEVRSFVSDKNTNVTSVQFVLRTGTIEAPEAPTDSSTQTEEPTLWEKLLALFGM